MYTHAYSSRIQPRMVNKNGSARVLLGITFVSTDGSGEWRSGEREKGGRRRKEETEEAEREE